MIRVLIADDQRINRILLRRCLDATRYEVVEAENGREALERFEAEPPDVVLLDVMMPMLDGFETARAMKERQGDDYVPIIMVTSLADEESLRQGMESGADDFVPKPFNRVVLESKMKACLRTRSLFRTLANQTAELRSLHDELHREQVVAEKLMAEVLRTSALEHPMFRFRSRPMDVFNGDLLLAARGPLGRMRLMLGDFSGHGLAAAIGGLPMVIQFESVCRSVDSPGEIARRANDELRRVLPRDRFLAAALLDFDPARRAVDVLNMGMPPLLLRRRQGELEILESTYVPLGIMRHFDAAEAVRRIELEPGDRLYLYSDGVTEAEGVGGEPFGEDRLLSIVGLTEEDKIFETVLDELDRFVGDIPPGDDVTLVEVRPDVLDVSTWGTSGSTSIGAGLHFHLTPEVLRSSDPMKVLESLLDSLEPLQGHRAEVFAVVAELVNNAVDHGLLRLDSGLKDGLEGFTKFYEERQRRLESCEEGYVDVSVRLQRKDERWILAITVEDSGDGFDPAERELLKASGVQAHGRGLDMVRGLCREVRFNEVGNRVDVVYACP